MVLKKNNEITLAAKHQNIIEEFKKNKSKLNSLQKELAELNKKLSDFGNNNSILNVKQINEKFEIRESIENIEKEIKVIENNENEDDYYIRTSHLLYDYFDNLDVNKDEQKINDDSFFWGDDIESDKETNDCLEDNDCEKEITINKESDIQKKSLTDFFQIKINNSNNQKEKKPENIEKKQVEKKIQKKNNSNNTKSTKISKFVTTTENFNRADILDKYMKIVDNSYIGADGCTNDNSIFYCEKCNIEKKTIHSEGYVVCSNCGDMDYIIIDSEKPSYKEPPVEISYFAYKRINHFNEWLAQFQAKESTEISQEILDMILLEIKKSRIKNMAILTHNKLREILKKLKLNKYYEHVPHIINRLNGLPPPVISRDIEEKLRIMFKEIQNPFLKVCPKGRKNFLSYSYVLHKFVELLSLDELLPCFPLLKSREKLHQQDKIWKDICNELQWEFIKSV